MIKKVHLVVLVLACLLSSVAAQFDSSASIPVDPLVKIGKLENGLTYYIRQNGKPEKKVELRLAVNIGSLHERDDQQGLAHFLEHMAFNGTTSFKKNELDSYLQSIGVQNGAHSNAYTSFNETVYQLSIPTKKEEFLDKGLLILSEWAGGMTLDPVEIDKERGVVLEEWRNGLGASERLRKQYYPKLFKNSRYAERLPIGKKTVLENFKHDSLIDFYKAWYRPDLMAVVAVGDLDVAETEKKIKRIFSKLAPKRKGIPKRSVFKVPDHEETLVSIATDAEATSTYAEVYVKQDLEKAKTLGDLKNNITETFFNWMLNERLNEILEASDPPFIEGYAGFSTLSRDKNAYLIYGETKPKRIEKTLEILLLESKRARQFGFTESELARQKLDYLTFSESAYMERLKTESSTHVANYVANFLSGTSIEGAEFEYEFTKKAVPTITLNDVNALAKSSISKRNRVVIITGPEKEKAYYPSEKRVKEILKQAAETSVSAYVDKISSEPLVGELKTTASIVKTEEQSQFGITRWLLSNGIKLILKPTDFQDDEILLRGISPGGTSVVPDEKIIPAIHVSSIANQSGIKDLSETQIVKKLAGKNASASTSISSLFERVYGSSSVKDFETMLQLVFLRITDVNFNERAFTSYVNKDRTFYENQLSDPESYFNNEVAKLVARGHKRFISPYDSSQYTSLNLADVENLYKARFSDVSDFTFILVGNFKPERIKPLILKYLGNLPTGKRSETWRDVDWRSQKGPFKKIFYKGIEQKSLVSISYSKDVPYDNHDRYLVYILGRLLNLKLNNVLREEKSGVYSVNTNANMSKIPYSRFSLGIYFPCSPKNVESLTKAAIGEVVKIRNGDISQKDLDKIKEIQRVGNREGSKLNANWLGRIEFALSRGLEILTDEEVEQRVNSLTIDEISRVARKYIELDKRVEFVLMPEDRKPQ